MHTIAQVPPPAYWVVLVTVMILGLLVAGVVGLISLIVNPKTRAVTLGLLAVAAVPVVLVLLLAGLWVSLRGSSEPATVATVVYPEPEIRIHNEPGVKPLPEFVEEEQAAQDPIAVEVQRKESKANSVLRSVVKALLTAMAQNKGNKAVVTEPEKAELPAAADTSDLPARPDRPEWVEAEAGKNEHGNYQMPIWVGPYSTRSECDAKLPEQLQSKVDEYVDQYLETFGPGARGRVRMGLAYIQEHIVKDEYEEWKDYSVGRMLKLHVLLQFDRQVNELIRDRWNQTIIARRLWGLGAVSAAVLLLLSTIYAYLRIDLATEGRYRGRLRLTAAAVSLALIAGLLLMAS